MHTYYLILTLVVILALLGTLVNFLLLLHIFNTMQDFISDWNTSRTIDKARENKARNDAITLLQASWRI